MQVSTVPGQDGSIPLPMPAGLQMGIESGPIPPDFQLLYPTIPKQSLEQIAPHPVTKVKTTQNMVTGGKTASKRLNYDGSVTQDSFAKRAKGAVEAWNTVQSFVPLRVGTIGEAGEMPFMHPPISILTAVPQLKTVDPGILRMTTNKF
jgi:hypothetical protein